MRVNGGPAPVVNLHRNRVFLCSFALNPFLRTRPCTKGESANLTGIRGFVRR
jgi:hypothetical protein